MIDWLHYIKLGFNFICGYNYIVNIRNNLSDQPMSNLAFYLMLTIYYIFLVINRKELDPAIDVREIYYMAVYPASDWVLFSLCASTLGRVVKRKEFLINYKAANISKEKKKDDLFDIAYLPVDYLSDVQEEDSD